MPTIDNQSHEVVIEKSKPSKEMLDFVDNNPKVFKADRDKISKVHDSVFLKLNKLGFTEDEINFLTGGF